MTFPLAASTSYSIGSVTALVAIGAALAWLLRRLAGRVRQGPPRPEAAPTGSTPPPGYGLAPPVAIADVTGAIARRRRAIATDAVAAVVVGVLLVGGILHAVGGGSSRQGHTLAGQALRAKFVAQCRRSAGDMVDCACVFAHLISRAPYDTPAGVRALQASLAAYQATSGIQALPQAYASATDSCRAVNT